MKITGFMGIFYMMINQIFNFWIENTIQNCNSKKLKFTL